MTVFYYCPAARKPVGGVKQTYRHVEALHGAGIDACVLAPDGDARGWFESSAPVAVLPGPAFPKLRARLAGRSIALDWLRRPVGPLVRLPAGEERARSRRLTASDVLVLPEFYGDLLAPAAFGARVVIFNQNAHYTFNGVGYDDDLSAFLHRRGALAALACSRHVAEYLTHAFPGLRVLLTPNGVDVDRFRPMPKKRQIAFMPRKLPRDLVQVLQIVRCRGALKGWQLCPIDGLAESEVARRLGESAFFLSSCEAEGFGLPPLEAAACACIVVGYCGQAAKEFMLPEYCYPVEQGDVLAFARTLERLLGAYARDPAALVQRARQHAAFVAQRYSREAERDGVVAAWRQILGVAAAGAGATATSGTR